MTRHPESDPLLGDRASTDAVQTLLIPRAVDLGEMEVRRALPSRKRQMVGPFIFFDQMGPATFGAGKGIDVRPHPHINLSTVTYLFDGEIEHRDSLGTHQTIQPGAVNLMTAGQGIVHSERTSPRLKQKGQHLSGIQTWLALPEDVEEQTPTFTHYSADDLPTIEADGMKTRLIAGEAFGVKSPLTVASATLYGDVILEKGAAFSIDPLYEERAIYIISGSIIVAGNEYAPEQLLILRKGEAIDISATSNARLMIFGGDPMEGPRYIWWNFVSSRQERIELAKEEWATGRFDTVPGDEEEFIPLPEDKGKPRRAVGGRAF
ncbi:MAG: pirin family protein [Pseudomonadota bacterium]